MINKMICYGLDSFYNQFFQSNTMIIIIVVVVWALSAIRHLDIIIFFSRGHFQTEMRREIIHELDETEYRCPNAESNDATTITCNDKLSSIHCFILIRKGRTPHTQ